MYLDEGRLPAQNVRAAANQILLYHHKRSRVREWCFETRREKDMQRERRRGGR